MKGHKHNIHEDLTFMNGTYDDLKQSPRLRVARDVKLKTK